MDDRKVLVITPDLSITGATTSAFSLVRILKELEYSVSIISSEDGEYRAKFEKLGCKIEIRNQVACSEEYKEHLRKDFDFVVVNSSSCMPYLYFFINTDTKVIWWLHETREQLESTGTRLIPQPLIGSNIIFAAAHRSVQRGIKELFGYSTALLPIPLFEPEKETKADLGELDQNIAKVRFFIPAAYTYIKGQDTLLKTIARLPKEYLDKSEFTFCGYSLEAQSEYEEKIFKMGNSLPNVKMLGKLDQAEVYDYYHKCDCVVAPSRIDSGPSTIIEAMSLKKLVLVSDCAGIAEYITDCVSGFVFGSEDELFQRLLLIISDLSSLRKITNEGYKVYLENYAPEVTKDALLEMIEG